MPSKRVYLKKWPVTAYRYSLCIHDWPDEVQLPGPGFDVKALDKASLAKLLEGYIQNQMENTNTYIQPHIERWHSRNFSPSHAVLVLMEYSSR